MSAPGAGRSEPARFEPWLVALLCVATLACWAPQFRFFFVPNNDYGTFEGVARSFGRLELPTSYQRLPLLPALMALLAPLLPGSHAYLDAALLLNLAFAVATLPLLYLFAARSLGRGALLVPVLFAGTALFHGTGLQPLVEPSLCFFVALAFVLFQRRSAWQYAAAAAAALSRYEAAALLPIFALAGALEDRRWRSTRRSRPWPARPSCSGSPSARCGGSRAPPSTRRTWSAWASPRRSTSSRRS